MNEQVDLKNITPLLRLFSAPEIPGRDAMCLALQMVQDTYRMDFSGWSEAGWQDITLQVDDTVKGEGDLLDAGSREKLEKELQEMRSRVNANRPSELIRGTMKQRREARTCKAVILAREMPGESPGYLVCISFMGTTHRAYDWISNLRMFNEGGMHQGFAQLLRQFQSLEEEITFPGVAKALQVERVTLRDILISMQAEDSPFRLMLTGHSQGGAIAQLYAYSLLEHRYVQKSLVRGICFASPTVADRSLVANPSDVPLFHVLNGDDLVPHMGLEVHLGKLLLYPPDRALRETCYRWSRGAEGMQRRVYARYITEKMTGTPQDLLVGLALLRLIRDIPEEEFRAFYRGAMKPLSHMPSSVHALLSGGAESILRRAESKAQEAYLSVTGQEMDMGKVQEIEAECLSVMRLCTPQGLIQAMSELGLAPHRATDWQGGEMGAYEYIVRFGTDRLVPAAWTLSPHPHMVRIRTQAPERQEEEAGV
ncbi:MAG: lipase family protein [Clostridia bacterium]|nr:lipase family protein [Clostridia bacterium]